jgi:mannan endo-1,4-beta-mannosidase
MRTVQSLFRLFRNLLLILSISGIYLNANGQNPWDPANSNSSDDVKKVLKFLYDIKGHGIITGQQNLAPDVMSWTDKVLNITGCYPGLLGEDFTYGNAAYLKRKEIVDTVTDYWNKGGLVTISWHQVNPETWDGSIDEGPFEYTQYQMSQEKFNQIFVPESDLQIKYQQHIDTIAGYLKQLQEAGVVVLWRPYHEMNGGWFWWGAKANFTDLWKGMFNRYTKYHHLNNLIWVWSPNISQSGMTDYYPGDEYVDIVGLDGYVDITNWDIRSSLSADIDNIIDVSKDNMVTFTELGWLPNLNWLQTDRPEFTWFLCWWTHITDYNSNRWISDVYNHSYAINRSDFIWKDFPVVLVNEFEDQNVINTGTPVKVTGDISSHFYYPAEKSIQIEISANRNDIAMDVSDSIMLYPIPGDTGTIIFQVIASNSADSIIRHFSVTLEPALSVQPGTDPNNRIIIFPNPATDQLHIVNTADIEGIIIYDLSGRLVKYIINQGLSERTVIIGDLDTGCYSICFKSVNGYSIRGFVKL